MNVYCSIHSRKAALTAQKQLCKKRPVETVEELFKSLNHYAEPKINKVDDATDNEDDTTTISNKTLLTGNSKIILTIYQCLSETWILQMFLRFFKRLIFLGRYHHIQFLDG